jgi:hypothetical protein
MTNERYAVAIENADNNYSAYVPDLPGCIATGPTVEAVEREIRDRSDFTPTASKPMPLRVVAATGIAGRVDA